MKLKKFKQLVEDRIKQAFYTGNIVSVEDLEPLGATLQLNCNVEIELGVCDLTDILKAINQGVEK